MSEDGALPLDSGTYAGQMSREEEEWQGLSEVWESDSRGQKKEKKRRVHL